MHHSRPTAQASPAGSHSRERPEHKEKPKGLTRAVGFVALILILFVASFSQSAKIVEGSARPADGALEASVRRAAQSAASQPLREAADASTSDVAVAAPAAAAQPAERPRLEPGVLAHEVEATAALPAPLTPVLPPPPPALSLPAKCHARAHTELEGTVVQWGTGHRQPDAAACCAACETHAAANPGRPCNVWVHCGDVALCGAKLSECWLKHTPDPSEPPSRGSGGKVRATCTYPRPCLPGLHFLWCCSLQPCLLWLCLLRALFAKALLTTALLTMARCRGRRAR